MNHYPEYYEEYDNAELGELGTLALGRDWYERLHGRGDPGHRSGWSEDDLHHFMFG